MKKIDRLIKLACYYNRIKELEFNRHYENNRIVDTRAMVYHLMTKHLNLTIFEISDEFNKPEAYIYELLKIHKDEYNIINNYTRNYENIESHFLYWTDTKLDLAYSIIKTKYDYDKDLKYENILNDNNNLLYENELLKRKLNKLKIYV